MLTQKENVISNGIEKEKKKIQNKDRVRNRDTHGNII